MPKITLDAETFKVLASDTRLQILKSLDERPKTVSELSRELELNKATVHEHLQQLLAGELIKKNEREGRKWVYYTLSWKGKSLLHPENTTVLVLLGLASIGSAGAVVQLGNWLRWWGANRIFGVETGGESSGDAAKPGEPEGAPPADDTREAERSFAAAEENGTGGDAAASDSDAGGFFDFLGDGEFWLFAVLALIATAALLGAALVKQRARGQTFGSIEAEPAKVGAVKAPGKPRDEDANGDEEER